MVTLPGGIVPPGPVSGCQSATDRLVSGLDSASTTTWNDSNSFLAARIVASEEPDGCSPGRTFATEPTTTTAAEAASAGGGDTDRTSVAARTDRRKAIVGVRRT